MSSVSKEIVSKTKETIKNSRIIMDNMMANKGEYNSKDLSWRNLEICNAILISLEGISIMMESLLSSDNTELDEDSEEIDSALNPNNKKKKGSKKQTIKSEE